MTVFKLGINNYFAVRRWPEPEKWSEIIGCEFDIDLVQFCFDLLDPRSNVNALTEVIGRTLDSIDKYGLSIPCCINGFIGYSQNLLLHPIKAMRIDALNWWEKAIILSSDLKAKSCGGFLGALSVEDRTNEIHRSYLKKNVVEDIIHLTHIGSSLKQDCFIFEAMAVQGEFPHTMYETKRLLDEINGNSKIPVRLLLDVGHPYGTGLKKDESDVHKWLRELVPKSYCIHLQQTDETGDCHWPFTSKYNKIGMISGEKVIDSIEESGVSECFLILEIAHPLKETDEKVIEDHKSSIQYWREALGL